jgi:DENN (AEX-3) domain
MYQTSIIQDEYIKYLKQAIGIRKEIQSVSSEVLKCIEANDNDKKMILSLQKHINDLDTQIKANKKASNSISTLSQMTNSLCADSATISSLSHSITLKKFPSRDSSPDWLTTEIDINESENLRLKLFEYFLIIGANPEKVESNCDSKAEALYSFPDNRIKDTKLVNTIKSYIFPKGVKNFAFRTNESFRTQVYEVLYHSYYREGNCFIFTVKPDKFESEFGYPEMVNNEKSVLYCCCVIYDDLVMNTYFGQQYIVPRCYCIVTYFPCFELHFEILYRLLAIKRAQRFENTNPMANDSIDTCYNLEEIFKGEELGLIETYYEYEYDELCNKFKQVSISLQSVEFIDYSFPDDYYFIDKIWLCPLLFSLLTPNDFYYLLCLILIEKNIVFISKNLDYLSSCVLGFQSLVMPFKLQHNIFPIIVESVLLELDKIDKFIIGCTEPLPEHLEASLKDVILVKLDENNLKSKIHCLYPDTKITFMPTYNLIDKIKEFYSDFQKRIVYIPDEHELNNAHCIILETNKFIKWVLFEINQCIDVANNFDLQDVRTMSLGKKLVLVELMQKNLEFLGYKNSLDERKSKE